MKIALFKNHPECSEECCDGMIKALTPHFNVETFGVQDNIEDVLREAKVIAFPGGTGDVNSYDKFFRRRKENTIADFVTNGGKYLGICIGAYWAGPQYFDIVDDVEVEQYIKRPTADKKRSYATTVDVIWNNKPETMFFYDGAVMLGDESKFKTIARYSNGEPMAIIKGNVGIIGCHPESDESWYKNQYNYINKHWHNRKHHKLLLDFVKELISV